MEIATCPRHRLPEVLALWRLAGTVPSATDDITGLLQLITFDPDALLVAIEDQRLVGAVVVGWDGWRGGFYRLAVLPEARRRGVATALVAAGHRTLALLGARRVGIIVVGSGGGGAAEFWRSVGYEFQPTNRRMVRDLPSLGDMMPQ